MKTQTIFGVTCLVLFVFAPAKSAPTSEQVEVDPNCDCDDKDALYMRNMRRFIDSSNPEEPEPLSQFMKDFKPIHVCGADGVKYRSRCEMQCVEAEKVEIGEDEFRGKCKPKLGRNGGPRKGVRKPGGQRKLRKNNNQNNNVVGGGETRGFEVGVHPRICICPRNYFPVCASNGVTYGNKCTFECAKENLDHDIEIVMSGKCEKDDRTFLDERHAA